MNEQTIKLLARQALSVMVLDLEYSSELWPMHGHTPIRHQLLWLWCEDILGKKIFNKEIKSLEKEKAEGNVPIKTNPWLVRKW